MIVLQDLLTSSGKYPERAKSDELTPPMLFDAKKLLIRVNKLLEELGIKRVTVSSGFRPSSVNNKIANAAKKSLHMTCNAIDILDVDGSLKKLIAAKPELLKKHSLWMEHELDAPTWLHLDQSKTRKDREIRIFRA